MGGPEGGPTTTIYIQLFVFIYFFEFLWCGREDSNFHGSYPTATSTLRVYQFRHDRTASDLVEGRIDADGGDVKRQNSVGLNSI